MPRYLVAIEATVSTTIPVEADSPEQAADQVWESDGFQDAHLGLCHQCESHMNAPGEWNVTVGHGGLPEVWLNPEDG